MLISINEIRFKVVLTTIINHQSIESMMTLDDLRLPFNTYHDVLHILLYLTYIILFYHFDYNYCHYISLCFHFF